jgi:hypothetical protein
MIGTGCTEKCTVTYDVAADRPCSTTQVFAEAERLWAAEEGTDLAKRRDEIIEEAKRIFLSDKVGL